MCAIAWVQTAATCRFLRIGRKDADFSTTAIHGIDTVRTIAGCGYRQLEIIYTPLESTPVGNISLEGTMVDGTCVNICFRPDSGNYAERIRVKAGTESYHMDMPIWDCPDYPGKIEHTRNSCLVEKIEGPFVDKFIASGFYDEHRDFYDALRSGGEPPYDPSDSLQSVIIMEKIRNRERTYTDQ